MRILPTGPVAPFLAALALAATAACASLKPAATAAGQPSPKRYAPPPAAELELQGLLLLLADRELYEPFTVERALDGGEEMRVLLATVLGRLGERRSLPVLQALLLDDAPRVRRAAAFALGEAGDESILPNLLNATVDPDRETGRLAVAAAAERGASVVAVGERLAGLPEAELWARLLPSLFRFQEEAAGPLARLGLLQASDPELRALAAFALCRGAGAGDAEDVRPLLADADPRVRGWAAQALGRIGAGGDLERLLPLLEDPEAVPTIHALRAGRALVVSGRAAAPQSWREPLVGLLEDPRPGVRMTAIEAAGAWLLDESLEPLLVAYAAGAPGRERELALLALTQAGHPQVPELVASAAAGVAPSLRRAAAEAAARIGAEAVLARLENDLDGGVRAAALGARLGSVGLGSSDEALLRAAASAREALTDPDVAVRATVCGWLAEVPLLPAEEVYEAAQAARRDRVQAARLAAVRALAPRAAVEPEDRANIVKALGRLADDPERLVRREAALGLLELGERAPAVGPQQTRRSVETYQEIALRTARPQHLEIVTARGTITAELACPEVPFTCLSLVQLARQGFYDGLVFHRVVPGFTVQTGDSRGDGWGGPGYQIRDEVNPTSFRRGVVGMALSGPDTAGSQFFITLAHQPQLDGTYTAVGRVVAGEEVLDRIVQGDRLETVRVLP